MMYAAVASAVDTVQEFIFAPSIAGWEKVRTDARATRADGYVAAIVDYELAVERRELPNSMASEATPGARAEGANRQCDVALRRIRKTMRPATWPLLAAMAKQDDDTVALAGFEVLCRLSLRRFWSIADDVLAKKPGRRLLVERTAVRWSRRRVQ
jgi:hypothetical protein